MQVATAQAPAPTPTSSKHPPGLYLLFFTEMWERFSYYGMRGLLVLYLTKTAAEGGLGIPEVSATKLYGFFTGFVYFTPIIGGWLADKYIGQRRAILIGGVTMAIAQICLFMQPALSTEPAILGMPWPTALGLLLLILGNGFFKPNISTIVGKLYQQGDPKRDAAFTIFYMGINVGAFFAPLVCGFLAEDLFATKTVVNGVTQISNYGFRYGFLAAGIGMIIGQLAFNLLGKKYLGDVGLHPEGHGEDKTVVKAPLTKEETDRMAVIFIVTLFVVFFWAGFEQAGSSLTLYTDKYINREVFGFLIPTSWFQSVNPLFIVAFAPLTAGVWLALGRKGKDLSIPVKMGLGMILLGAGFLFMVGAVMQRGGDVQDQTIKASILWLLATYFFHTIGELCLSPIGLSMVSRLSPVSLTSMLMGVWFLAPFVAQIAGGYIAAYVEELGALKVFGLIAAFVIGAGLLLILVARKLFHMMHGRG
ncbi:peptide MFS transporter [Hymenobacter busanensis]|uniref:Peptide MFS transporter n=1 Tax=Hymenobacter busanensis TaxID=2607656 RepID=A0A7L4ZT00_9BACT|nr:peptide MFS transporter [Hymenobacter busanensis]KAA9325920.1 peptide MFS transporter [Hymenobacter busanensis]QHJ06241.1 MFS transporter [Hymenobacter busanensis]